MIVRRLFSTYSSCKLQAAQWPLDGYGGADGLADGGKPACNFDVSAVCQGGRRLLLPRHATCTLPRQLHNVATGRLQLVRAPEQALAAQNARTASLYSSSSASSYTTFASRRKRGSSSLPLFLAVGIGVGVKPSIGRRSGCWVGEETGVRRLLVCRTKAVSNKAGAGFVADTRATEVYIIKPGDWVADVAASCGVHVEDIRVLNPNVDLDFICTGQKIIIPKTRVYASEAEVEADGDGGEKRAQRDAVAVDARDVNSLSPSPNFSFDDELDSKVPWDQKKVGEEEGKDSENLRKREDADMRERGNAAANNYETNKEKSAEYLKEVVETEKKKKNDKKMAFGLEQLPFLNSWKAAMVEATSSSSSESKDETHESESGEGGGRSTTVEETDVYIMKRGDWVSSVAMDLGISMSDLRRLNPDTDLDNVRPKQKLIIPKISPGDFPSSPSPSPSLSKQLAARAAATNEICPSPPSLDALASRSPSLSSSPPSPPPPPPPPAPPVCTPPRATASSTGARSSHGASNRVSEPTVGLGGISKDKIETQNWTAAADVCGPPPRATTGGGKGSRTESASPAQQCAPSRAAQAGGTKQAREVDGRGAIARGLAALLRDGKRQNTRLQSGQEGIRRKEVEAARVKGILNRASNTELYKVRRGEGLETIALARGVSVEKLKLLNPSTELDRLRLGQQIVVPIKKQSNDIASRKATEEGGSATNSSTTISTGGSGGPHIKHSRHMVEPGDFLNAIADKYEVDVNEVMKLNGMSLDDPIKVGQVLLIPFRKTLKIQEDGDWQQAQLAAGPIAAAAGGAGGGGGGGGRMMTTSVGRETGSLWAHAIETVAPLQGVFLACTILGVGILAMAGYVAGAASSSRKDVVGRRMPVRRRRKGGDYSAAGGVVAGGKSGRIRTGEREVILGGDYPLPPVMPRGSDDESYGVGANMTAQASLRIGDGYSAGESLEKALSKAAESARMSLGLAVATLAIVAVSGNPEKSQKRGVMKGEEKEKRQKQQLRQDDGEEEEEEEEMNRKVGYDSPFWRRNDEVVSNLSRMLPKECALHGLTVTGLLANGQPSENDTSTMAGGATAEKGGNDWAAVLLLSSPDALISTTSMLGPGGPIQAVQTAVSLMNMEVAGLQPLKAVVVQASAGMGSNVLEMVVGLLPGVPAYAVAAGGGGGTPAARGWLVPAKSKSGVGAAGQGVSLIGVTAEAEFGGAFLATVIGQWLYGPQCVVVARPPLIPSSTIGTV